MPTFASIDFGSNACRLLIAEADEPKAVRRVHSLRFPVRLGHSVFLTGQLDRDAIDSAVEALKAFKAELDTHEIAAMRAVVTASARDAVNADVLLGRAREEGGITLEAISGTEEARLVKLAVETRLTLGGYRSLLVDLGGGSLELSEVHHDEVRHAVSLEIGTVRLLESFLSAKKPVTRDQEKLLVEYIDRMIDPVAENYRKRQYDIVAGTGGNFDAIAQLCPMAGCATPTIDVRAAEALLTRMKKLTPAERRAAYDLRPDRADVIVPALYVVLAVARLARTEEIVAPGVGLKEGILTELIDRHFRVWDENVAEHTLSRAAIHLGRRYHFDEPHATQVDRLACILFDQLAPLHELGAADRPLLRVASILHDVGDFVASAAHHKHSQYIIEHSDLMGLAPEERQLVACVARYHRRATPSPKHTIYKKLSPIDRRRVRKLASLLRLADGLDRSHRSKVRHLEVELGPETVVLRADGGGDLALEAWTARRKAELFEKTFERTIRLEVPERVAEDA